VEGVGDHGCEYMTGGTVVILGETGRNFAAGMSGGVAYIFDRANSFKRNCNMEMVMFDEMDTSDEELIRKMVLDHFTFTGSEVASDLLKNWKELFSKFVKVMPLDYKAALQKKKTSSAVQVK
jgi:glutamate synthase (NADPH/NADH) large chain